VEPGHPDFGRAFPCSCRLERVSAARLQDLRRAGNLEVLSRMTFETFKPEGYGLPPKQRENLKRAYQLARRYAEDPQGWLILLGGYGCGKTHLAAAIANYRVDRGQAVLLVVVPDLLDHLRATFNPESPVGYDERFEAVRNAPLLILDDLGTHSVTPWTQEKLYQIFNYRYNARLPTVITSNHTLEEIDLRLRSRMSDPDLCQVYRIESRDFRASGGDRYGGLNTLNLYGDKTFETFDCKRSELPEEERENLGKAYKVGKDFAESPDGWLVFIGGYGCGKTHLAAAIANYWNDQGQQVLFIPVPDLLDHLRATFGPHSAVSYDKEFEKVRHAPFLVLDDLGTHSATPWAQEKLYQVFNYRYHARLPTVITMRGALEEADPWLASRMLDHSLCTVYGIIAPPYRGGMVGQKRGQRSPRRTRGTSR
jgi:DNA replication protein DnaC